MLRSGFRQTIENNQTVLMLFLCLIFSGSGWICVKTQVQYVAPEFAVSYRIFFGWIAFNSLLIKTKTMGKD